MIGAVALACGYFPLWSAYEKGPGSLPFGVLCLSSLLTGAGSCSAFAGAIKTCASNWPQHRGTATAFPLSGFGLSAFAFTMIGGFVFPNDVGGLLLLLATGTFSMVFVGMFFLRMTPPAPQYQSVPTDEPGRPAYTRKNSSQLHRTTSRHSKSGSKSDFMHEPSKSFRESVSHLENSFQCLVPQTLRRGRLPNTHHSCPVPAIFQITTNARPRVTVTYASQISRGRRSCETASSGNCSFCLLCCVVLVS